MIFTAYRGSSSRAFNERTQLVALKQPCKFCILGVEIPRICKRSTCTKDLRVRHDQENATLLSVRCHYSEIVTVPPGLHRCVHNINLTHRR